LPRRIGVARAKWMILTGDTVSGTEAKNIGLVDEVVSKEALDRTVSDFAVKLAGKPPLGLKKIKEAVNRGMEVDLQSGLTIEQEVLAFLLQTEDFQEGVTAFIEKREPQWKGR